MIISKSAVNKKQEPPGQRTNVLFVEDDKVDQIALKRSFEMEEPSFDFSIVGSVREAKKKLEKERFDIVIIDFMLSDGTAFDVLQKTGDTPSIVVTGQGSVEIAVEAIRAGASDYLIKEPNHSHLLTLTDTINNTIKNHRVEQRAQMLSEAMASVSDGVYITNLDHEIIYVNKTFENVYGYSEEEVLGKKDAFLNAKPKAGAEQMAKDASVPILFQKRKDGTEFAVSLSQSTVANKAGGPQYIITVVHDMMEHTQKEQALLAAIEKYSALLALVEDKNQSLEKQLKRDAKS